MSILLQRSLFYGTNDKPYRPSPQAPPVPKRRFRSTDWQGVRFKFDDPSLTGRAGMPLVFLHQRALGLKGKLGRAIKMDRRSDAFRPAECSKFLIDCKLEGMERLSHVDTARTDPVYCREYGLTELPCGKTVGEYLKAFSHRNLACLDGLNRRFADWLIRKALKRAQKEAERRDGEDHYRDGAQKWQDALKRDEEERFVVGLDFDSTCMAVYGKQEGADRGRHPRKKDKPGFQPKFAFLAGLDAMVHQKLYPESRGLNSGFRQFYQEAKEKLPEGTVLGYVRGDCAVYSKDNVQIFEHDGLVFGVSAQKTAHMWRAIELFPEECWQRFEDQDGDVVELAELYYRPASWPGEHRVYILSRRLKKAPQKKLLRELEYKVFAYLTNFEGTLWERYKFCVGRCTVEKCIRESKLGFDWHHLPCAQFDANRAYLGHVQCAYNFMISFKLTALGKDARRWSADTVRRNLLSVPGRFSARTPDILHLPAWWPHRHQFRYAVRSLSDFKN